MNQHDISNTTDASRASNLQVGPITYSYYELRTAVGVVGALLPPVLAIGNLVAHALGIECQSFASLECSISNYYHTCMRNIFVGSLCVIGFFLLATRGYRAPDHKDEIAGRLACVCALGVAMFPTGLCGASLTVISTLHLIFAALLFLTLAYFCIKLFIRTGQGGQETSRKLLRNNIYRACGWTIIISILLIPVALYVKAFQRIQPEFWLESIAVEAFAFAWLVKGRVFFKDTQDAPAG